MRRNVTRWVGIAGLALVLGPLAGRAADQRIVFVDLDRAFSEFYKTKLADAQLKEQADEFNAERKKMVEQYEKIQQTFNAARDEAQNTALSEAVRSEKRGEAEERLVEMRDYESRIRTFDESRRKQLDDQSRRMRKRIVDEIRQVVESFARTEGYDAVVDSSGQSMNGVEIIVYADSKIDITDSVLDILNKGSKDETPAKKAK